METTYALINSSTMCKWQSRETQWLVHQIVTEHICITQLCFCLRQLPVFFPMVIILNPIKSQTINGKEEFLPLMVFFKENKQMVNTMFIGLKP